MRKKDSNLHSSALFFFLFLFVKNKHKNKYLENVSRQPQLPNLKLFPAHEKKTPRQNQSYAALREIYLLFIVSEGNKKQ